MGRVSDKTAYQVKNTFVQIQSDDANFSRQGQRTLSESNAPRPSESPQIQASPYYMPQTPSPFMRAYPDPCGGMPLPNFQLGGGMAMPLAFGEFDATVDDSCGQGYNLGEAANFGACMQYDPNTGAYMIPYDANCFMPYDPTCFNMINQEMVQDQSNPEDNTKMLLNALSEKISEDQIQVPLDGSLQQSMVAPLGGICEEGQMESWDAAPVECWDQSTSWGQGDMSMGAVNDWAEDQQYGEQQQQQSGNRRKSERREAREAARRQERAAAVAAIREQEGGKGASQWGGATSQNKGSSGCITTVMFRNIPNKYTREMLVDQLEQDMKGLFDFLYLPIDFKNKCNVGYAFINFRTVEACDEFVNMFNGVEVRKCLPGLNSRKVTEVTPARVQGFEENVQRLRNSPVMRELVHKPEWMPLIFDYNGEQTPFPAPECPLDPIKPRRRARDDEARLL